MRLALIFTMMALVGCDSGSPKVSSNWYDTWLAAKLDKGAVFHSEFALKSGEKNVISIDADSPTQVGYVVKEGYEVTKSTGTIHLGTEDQPKMVGGSPGTSHVFPPKGGKIVVVFENTSPIDTRLAVYTNKSEGAE
jgi:hypothetical protein